MASSDQTVVLKYNKLLKGWRRGKPPPSITFVAYPNDKSICVLATLRAYLDKTKPWRVDNSYSQLLLSFINPHKPVSSDSVAR